ncbi:MAG: hypothetical protein HY057_12190 [Rhodospirillales bacterium]|nr:hypothetical protein [Rhodospirillales bacterium]
MTATASPSELAALALLAEHGELRRVADDVRVYWFPPGRDPTTGGAAAADAVMQSVAAKRFIMFGPGTAPDLAVITAAGHRALAGR